MTLELVTGSPSDIRICWYDRLGPSVLAFVTVFVAVGPMTAAPDWQARHYPAVNAHNLIFTTALTAVPDAITGLGLPGCGRVRRRGLLPGRGERRLSPCSAWLPR
jgi:hypothetical protein